MKLRDKLAQFGTVGDFRDRIPLTCNKLDQRFAQVRVVIADDDACALGHLSGRWIDRDRVGPMFTMIRGSMPRLTARADTVNGFCNRPPGHRRMIVNVSRAKSLSHYFPGEARRQLSDGP